MVFLAGSAAYWLVLIVGEIRDLAATTIDANNTPVPASAVTHSFLLPSAWSQKVPIAIGSLVAIYLSVLLVLIGTMAFKHLRMRALLRHAVEPSASLSALFLNVSRDMRLTHSGISRTRLIVLPGLKSPATAGFLNPRILLPEICEQIGPTPQVADVLCHELIHVARRDYLWAGMNDLICCFLFFHPAVWKARKAMTLQAELACDLAVLETRVGDRADYADSLTYFVRLRMLQDGFSLGVDFAASTSLGLRIRTILTTPKPVAWWKTCSRAAAGLSLIAAVGVLAPFMALSLGVAGPLAGSISNQPPAQLSAQPTRNSRHRPRRAISQETPKDSLTTLRTQPYISETPAYTMTSNSDSLTPSASEVESPAWQKSQPTIQRPSVASVVRTTLGEIVAMGRRGGRDHDKNDH
jgi:beta-lactamase regulating signal transducer with metallopeptidase domain